MILDLIVSENVKMRGPQHWRHNTRDEPAQPLVANNQKTKPK